MFLKNKRITFVSQLRQTIIHNQIIITMNATLTTPKGTIINATYDLLSGMNIDFSSLEIAFSIGKNQYKGKMYFDTRENNCMVIKPCTKFCKEVLKTTKTNVIFPINETKEQTLLAAKEVFKAANTSKMRYDLTLNEFQCFNTIAGKFVSFFFETSFEVKDFLKKNIKNLPKGFAVENENSNFEGYEMSTARYINFDFSALESEKETVLAAPLKKADKIAELAKKAQETGELQYLDTSHTLVETGEEMFNKATHRWVNAKGEIILK